MDDLFFYQTGLIHTNQIRKALKEPNPSTHISAVSSINAAGDYAPTGQATYNHSLRVAASTGIIPDGLPTDHVEWLARQFTRGGDFTLEDGFKSRTVKPKLIIR